MKKYYKRNRTHYLSLIIILMCLIVIMPLTLSLMSLSERKLKEEDEFVVKVYKDFECFGSLVKYKENTDELTLNTGCLIVNAEVEEFTVSVEGYEDYHFNADYKLVKYGDGSILYCYQLPYIYDINNIRLKESATFDVYLNAIYGGKSYVVNWNKVDLFDSLSNYDLSKIDVTQFDFYTPTENGHISYSESGWTIIKPTYIHHVLLGKGSNKRDLVANVDYFKFNSTSTGERYYLVKGDCFYYKNAFTANKNSYYSLSNEEVSALKLSLSEDI